MKQILPNLFIIGAMKAGTSSLHEYLHQHPQIFMSRMKEPQYFAPHTSRMGVEWGQGNPHPEPGIDWYLRLFSDAGDVKYAGESSVSYTAIPRITGCEQRIYDFNSDARMIFLMRDPIERVISHYWHNVKGGGEDRDPLTAVTQTEDYVARSDYARQLTPYLDRFGHERVYTLTLEELTCNPDQTFRKLFEWLEVDPDRSIDIKEKHNVGLPALRQTRRGLVFLDTFQRNWRWQKLQARFPRTFGRLLQTMTYRAVDRRQVDTRPTIQYLRPILQESSKGLASLLGRGFPEWQTLYPDSSDHVTKQFVELAP